MASWKVLLAVECAALFVLVPLLLLAGVVDVPWVLPLIVATAACAVWLTRHDVALARWCSSRELRRVLLRFGVAAVGLVGVLAVVAPERLRFVPAERPWMFLVLAVAYPLLSVWPQELLYRAYFFERYDGVFGRGLQIASAIAFAAMHLLYMNAVAVVLTFAGGLWFASTYARTRSLPLVWLEHSLFGLLVFAVGLGEFFHSASFV